MGIKGLVTFCKGNSCYEEYDLVSLVKRYNNLELLVDFYGIEQHILELSLKNLCYKYRNEYLILPGGEYDELIYGFREFCQVFKNLGINLVFIADGPKGLDKENRLNKEKSWNFRFEKNVINLHKDYLEYSKNPQSPYQIIKNIIVRPFLIHDLFKIIIKREGGEIISLVYGEADYQIAKLRLERNSWAVLTNDSDFFVFRNCPTIQIAFFDLERDLMMGRGFRENNDGRFSTLNPKKLIVGVVSDSILMSRLNISKFSNLIDFACLMGNDYTSDFAESLRDFFGIRRKNDGGSLADSFAVAEWVERQTKNLSENPLFFDFLKLNPECKQFVDFSFEFYNCTINLPERETYSERNDNLWCYLESRYKLVDIPSISITIFHGFCYQRNCVEPHNSDMQNDINYLLIPLRKIIYGLFLQDGKDTVIEYEVPNTSNFSRLIPVENSQIKINDIVNTDHDFSYHDIKLKSSYWKFFEESWSFWDFEKSDSSYSRSIEYFRRFRTDIGFACYCLRTLWILTKPIKTSNSKPSLVTITQAEFRAVFCAIFFKMLNKLKKFSKRWCSIYNKYVLYYKNDWFFQLKVCPSSNCIIVQEWLQTIYHLAYNVYGRSLRINHFFPEPSEFFSGTIITTFFEYVHNNGQRLRNLSSNEYNDIYELMSIIMDEFSYVFDAIIKPF